MVKQVFLPKAKTYVLIALAILVVALSWFRSIDNFTEDYINDSIRSAGIIFGISRAINAAVSVTQSAEVSLGFASFAPGESFDPINDLIERFSEVMTISIASLVFQKILLGVASHWIFNSLVTLSAIAFIMTLVLRQHVTTAFKAFSFLVIVRLFLSLVILANSAVDKVFLDSQIQSGERNMRLLETQVSTVSSGALKQAEGTATNVGTDSKALIIEREIQHLDDQKSDILGAISKLNLEIESIRGDRPWWSPSFLSKDPQVQEAKKRIEVIKNEIADRDSKLQDIDEKASELNDEKECLEKQSQGETCSWIDSFFQYGGSLKQTVMQSPLVFEEKVDELITLMALIVLRSILLPIFFWVLVYKTIKWIWTNPSVQVSNS